MRVGTQHTHVGVQMGSAWIHRGLHSHPKRRAVGFEAMGLWAVASSYAADYETGGTLPREAVAYLCAGDEALALRLAARLVDAGLWSATDAGWLIHDYAAAPPDAPARRKPRPTTPPLVDSDPTPVPAKQGALPGFTPAAEPAPLPFTVDTALRTLRDTAGPRVAIGDPPKITPGQAVRVTGQIKRFGELAQWTTMGTWLAAGGRARMGTFGVSWVACDDFASAMAEAAAWHAQGRPAIGLQLVPGRTAKLPPVAAHVPGSVRDYNDDPDGDSMFEHPDAKARRAAQATG